MFTISITMDDNTEEFVYIFILGPKNYWWVLKLMRTSSKNINDRNLKKPFALNYIKKSVNNEEWTEV